MTTPPTYPPPAGYGPPQVDTIWAVLSHLSIFAFALLGPLVVYLVFKDTAPFTRQHAAEALNFHLTLLIASIVAIPLVIVLIGIPLLVLIAIGGVVLGILAAIAAGNRQPYRYPLTIHFVQ